MKIGKRWATANVSGCCILFMAIAGSLLFPPRADAAFSLVMTNGYGDCYRMNLLRDRENYQAYRGVCSYRGFSLSGCSTTGEVVMLRIKGTPSMPEYFSILSTSMRWGTTMYVLNDVFHPLCSWVSAGYENWYPFDMSCSVAMYINSGGYGYGSSLARAVEVATPAPASVRLQEEPVLDEQREAMEILAQPPAPQAKLNAFSLVMTNGYGDCYRMNLLRDRENYQAYRGVCSYRGFSLSGCSTTGEVVMLRIKGTPSMPEHYSIVSTSLRWGQTMYFLNDVFRPLNSWVLAGYENWYPFDMSCSVAMYIHSGGLGVAGTEKFAAPAWPAAPVLRNQLAAPIRIGVMVPLTGDLADIGSSYTSAYAKAMSEITNTPGMPSIELLVENTDADPVVAAMKLVALYTSGVQVVIGPETSAECNTLLSLTTNGNEMLLLSSSCTAPQLAITNDNLMRFTMDDTHQARALAQQIAADGITNLAVLKRSDMYGDGMREAFWNEYTNLGGTVFFSEYYPRVPDLLPEVISNLDQAVTAQVAVVGADGVGVLIVAFDEGVVMLQAASTHPGLTSVRWYGTEGMAGNAALLENSAALDAARRTRFVCSQPSAYTNAKYAEVRDAIQADIGHPPRTFAVVSYDTLWLAALALKDVGGVATIATLRQAIRTNAANYAGASGPIVLNGADDRADGEYDFLKISDSNTWADISLTAPNAPIVLPAANITSNQFTARWQTTAGATNYWLDVAEDGMFSTFLPGFSNAPLGNVHAHALTGLTPGQTYYYRVRAGNAAGTGLSSETMAARVWEATLATNGVPVWWLAQYYAVSNNANELALGDSDFDGQPAWQEFVADTKPNDSNSWFGIKSAGIQSPLTIHFMSSTGRFYTLYFTPDLEVGSWSNVAGQGPRLGVGGEDSMTDGEHTETSGFHRIGVEVP